MDRATHDIELSIVIPVFGCEPCLVPLFERLGAVLESLPLRYEVIFVDDGTRDGSRDTLARIAGNNPHVAVHRLDRNSGQHAAITAGLSRSSGHRVVVMDCDLQHPPESIPRLLEASTQGHDIVLGTRTAKHDSRPRRVASRAFRNTLGSFHRFPNQVAYGTYSLLTRIAVNRYLEHPDAGRGYLVVLDRLDLPFTLVGYHHGQRFTGRSAYTLPRLVRHALNSSWNKRRLLFLLALLVLAVSGCAVLWWILRGPGQGT